MIYIIKFLLSISLLTTTMTMNAEPSAVHISEVEEKMIVPTVSVTGNVYSRNDVRITAGISSRINSVVEPGSLVAKGDILITLDNTDLLLQKKEQQALIKKAKFDIAFVDKELARQTQLAKKNGISISQLEQLKANRQTILSELELANIELEKINLLLSKTQNKAPFNGMVTQQMHFLGEDVAQGANLLRLTNLDQLEVRVQVPLNYANRIKSSDRITLYGFNSRQQGQVRSVIPNIDSRSQTMELRIDLNTNENTTPWTIGQLVSVAIPLAAPASSIAVPRDALVLRQNGAFVFKVNSVITPGKIIAEKITVKIGESTGNWVAVTGNVSAGDCVVIRGAETLKDGDSVNIISRSRACG